MSHVNLFYVPLVASAACTKDFFLYGAGRRGKSEEVVAVGRGPDALVEVLASLNSILTSRPSAVNESYPH